MLYFAYYAYAECFGKCLAAYTSSSSDLLIFSSVGSSFSCSVFLPIHCVISLSALPHARAAPPLGWVSLPFPPFLSLSISVSVVRFYSFIYLRIFHVFSSFCCCLFFPIFGNFYKPPPSSLSVPLPLPCFPLVRSSFCIFARTKLPLYCFDLSYFVCCQRWVARIPSS